MDIKNLWKKAPDFWQKYKYVILVLAVGLLLMVLPETTKKEKQSEPISASSPPQAENEEARLETILSQIRGAGEVRVLLSKAKGEEILYQTDDDIDTQENNTSTRIETVVINGSEREEAGLIRQVNPPVYLGAVVVCQGADDPVVRLALVEAVSDITGLGSDRISILKMK